MQQTGLIQAYRLGEMQGALPYRHSRKKRDAYHVMGPRVPLAKVASKWFVHIGQIYSVQTAPDIAFKRAVTNHSMNPYVLDLLQECHLDIYSRWYILCEVPIELYDSKEEAERSMADGK